MTASDNTTRFAFPTSFGVGRARGREEVLLQMKYTLEPIGPEEYQVNFALDRNQSTAISRDILAMTLQLQFQISQSRADAIVQDLICKAQNQAKDQSS